MAQLIFDERMNIIDDLNSNFKKFVNGINDHTAIIGDYIDETYCGKCMNKLINEYCPKCKIDFSYVKLLNCFNYDHNYNFFYYIDVIDNNVFVYCIRSDIIFPILYSNHYSKCVKNEIYKVYRVTEENVKELYKIDTEEGLLYTNNLDILKTTSLYKYSFIWESKKYLKRKTITLKDLVTPLIYPQFEYLVKLGFYQLAYTHPERFDKHSEYKKYQAFIKKYDLNFDLYQALNICNIEDIDFLCEISLNLERLTYNKKAFAEAYKINYQKMYRYYRTLNKLNKGKYIQYIFNAIRLKFDITDHNVLAPTDFEEAYNKVEKQYYMVRNPKANERIDKLSKILDINKYCDDKYIIIPAHSVNDMIDESGMQHNCLKDYINVYSNNECQIYFMRYKNKPSESLVTIEIKDNKIKQAKAKLNEDPNKEELDVLHKWEKQLIPIEKDI
jgi:hypothetical protein